MYIVDLLYLFLCKKQIDPSLPILAMSCNFIRCMPSYLHFQTIYCFMTLNPLSPHDALEHHFASLKTDLIFLQLRI